jgi:cysteinyl-tRNA synthetase
MHGGLLSFDGRKMAKSLGNFEPLCALLDRHDPRAIRFLFLQTGYRKPMNFSEDSISGATEGLRGLLNTYACLAVAARKEQSAGVGVVLKSHAQRFYAALEDDMNTAGAVGELFKFAQNAAFFIETGLASEAEAFMRQALDMLGISSAHAPQTQATDPSVKLGPDFIERLHARLAECVALNGAAGAEAAIESVISARKAARLAKDFALADRLRGALAEEGVLLTDAKEGTTWSVAG